MPSGGNRAPASRVFVVTKTKAELVVPGYIHRLEMASPGWQVKYPGFAGKSRYFSDAWWGGLECDPARSLKWAIKYLKLIRQRGVSYELAMAAYVERPRLQNYDLIALL